MPEFRPPDSGAAPAAPSSPGAGSPPDDERPVGADPAPGESAAGTSAPPAVSPPPGVSPPPADVPSGAEGSPPPASPPLPPPPAPPVASGPDDQPEAAPSSSGKRSWTPVLLVLLLVSVSVGAYFGFRGGDDEPAPPADFVRVHDEEAGFSVSYPEIWTEVAPATADRRLLLSAGGDNSFLVRVQPVDPATAVEGIAAAMSGVRMVTEPRQFTLNGVQAYYFLYYTEVTEDSPVQGVHAHYFLVNGDTLYTMVFQAMPTEDFSRLAPVFDKVAESFEVDDPVAPPATTAPTAAPTEPTTPTTGG